MNNYIDKYDRYHNKLVTSVDPKTFSDVHKLAWELGVKTLYYCKSTKDRIETTSTDECLSCQG